jgi:para-nitrobenzyl esterase
MILGNTRDETRAFIDPRGPKLAGLDWSNLAERLAPEVRIDLDLPWVVAQYRARFPEWSAERVFYAASTAGRSWPGQVIEADARAAAGASGPGSTSSTARRRSIRCAARRTPTTCPMSSARSTPRAADRGPTGARARSARR